MSGYRLEYAISDRSICKGPRPCSGTPIGKGEFRVNTHANRNPSWRHWGCVTPKIIENMKKSFKEASELDGYEDLRLEDQAKFIKAWRDGRVAEEDVPDSARRPADEQGEETLTETQKALGKRKADESDGEATEKYKKFKTVVAQKVTNESDSSEDEAIEEEDSPRRISIDSLRVSANIGPDCWAQNQSQPIDISLFLHFKESFLDGAGASDGVWDSAAVYCDDLVEKIRKLIKAKSDSDTPSFSSPDDLIKAVTEQAFDWEGEVAAVRVIMGVPKMILLAAGFSVDITTVNDQSKSIATKQVFIKDIILPVIIGDNLVERKKQRVKVNLIFHENPSSSSSPSPMVNYQQVVRQLCQEMESSSYLTLETFVMQILRTACMCSDRIEAVTARAQKPSALSFAESSGVEITRKRDPFLR